MIEPLSSRELEVLLGVANGDRLSDVAGALYLSTSTVKSHGDSMRAKLGAKTLAHAVAIAYHEGLLVPRRPAG